MVVSECCEYLDLDDELDDYDGGNDYAEEDGEGANLTLQSLENMADICQQSLAKKIKVRRAASCVQYVRANSVSDVFCKI